MIGGMVPPIAIAIASLLFKNKFTEQERKAGPTTSLWDFHSSQREQFHSPQPIRYMSFRHVWLVQVSLVDFPQRFNCTLMAPHGGIFVFPVVGHAAMYLVALVVGSIISALLLGVLKKKVVA